MKDRRISSENVAREVLAAIRRGHRTFAQIQHKTGRTAGRISDALALLLDTNLIRIESRDDATRHYLPMPIPRQQQREGAHGAQHKAVPALSFSTLCGLMPHRSTTADAPRALAGE
jgi:hypothetical protein